MKPLNLFFITLIATILFNCSYEEPTIAFEDLPCLGDSSIIECSVMYATVDGKPWKAQIRYGRGVEYGEEFEFMQFNEITPQGSWKSMSLINHFELNTAIHRGVLSLSEDTADYEFMTGYEKNEGDPSTAYARYILDTTKYNFLKFEPIQDGYLKGTFEFHYILVEERYYPAGTSDSTLYLKEGYFEIPWKDSWPEVEVVD
jgi:hypothetical protein